MIQIEYQTSKGKEVTLYPKSERETKEKLQRLAARHVDADLIEVRSGERRRIGGSETLDDVARKGSRYIWHYDCAPFRLSL